ncbi:hypothetical protein [Marinobacter arenosus]|uniref:hypothetical protein n=1 Tax=Marinobacter arenosus TaxID=2856822 RepID=UPI001C4B5294|nr:hypothetical protein [Marinobacter arenosus]MBW0146181.1 hypothetical protein [Marinobacter arenosus]
MSIEMKAVQAMCVRVLWSGDCVELLELGVRQACGYLTPTAYEVHIPGQSVLYKSASLFAAQHYIEILLGCQSDADPRPDRIPGSLKTAHESTVAPGPI